MKEVFFCLLLLLPPMPDARKKQVTLSWNLNPENNIAGYNLYYGKSSSNYGGAITVTAPPVTVEVGRKTIYFVVTAFNLNGQESDYSNEVKYP